MKKSSISTEKVSQFESKFGFYEVFIDKKIKKTFHNMKNHTMDKKYINKIPLQIIETIAIDKGQFYFWVFTDSSGYVMKKSNKKLNKTYMLDYFLNMILDYFRIEEGFKISKTFSQIVTDITRFSNQDEKLDEKLIELDPSYSYLKRFIQLQNFYIIYSQDNHRKPNFVNIFEFNKIINDGTTLNGIVLIQNYLFKNHKYKPLIFQYIKPSNLEAKKVFLKIQGPVRNLSNNENDDWENFNNYQNKDSASQHEIININDNNLSLQIDGMLEPFIKLIEKSYNVTLRQSDFQLFRFRRKINEEDKRHVEYLVYSFCNSIMAVDKSADEYLRKEDEMKNKMQLIKEKNIPKDLRVVSDSVRNTLGYLKTDPLCISASNTYTTTKNLPTYVNTIDTIRRNSKFWRNANSERKKTQHNTASNINSRHTSENDVNKQFYSNFKDYYKISSSAFCNGEFCEYYLPNDFRSLKKDHKLELLINKIPLVNKISLRDKNYNLPYYLPFYIIKKAYDNPGMVNIVLKAYSIFPYNFDKEKAIRLLEQRRKEKEEQRREREKREEEEQKRIEEDRKRMKYSVKFPLIGTNNSSNPEQRNENQGSLNNTSSKKEIDCNDILENSFTSSSMETEEILPGFKYNRNKGITLYIPDEKKFKKLNHDSMYSQKSVCKKCYVIYVLIESFLSNIDETTSQFISLKKAREILMLGDQVKTPNQLEDSLNQDQSENLLFQEEKSDFNLKYILKRNLKKWKQDAEKEKERHRSNPKIVKKRNNKKSEYFETFSYNLDINPKLLKFNLIAEKTKNTFFNLIFNELKNKPESIYHRLGIKRNLKNYPKSMTTLRMHMGINSLGYNIEYKDFEKLSDKFSIEHGKLHETDKKEGNKISKKNKNFSTEMYQIDVDLFHAYKNLMKKFLTLNSENAIDNFCSKGEMEKDMCINEINNLDLINKNVKASSLIKSQIFKKDSLYNVKHEKMGSANFLPKVSFGIDLIESKKIQYRDINPESANTGINNLFEENGVKNNFSSKRRKTGVIKNPDEEKEQEYSKNKINDIDGIMVRKSKPTLIKRQFSSLKKFKSHITFNFEKKEKEETADKNQNILFQRSASAVSAVSAVSVMSGVSVHSKKNINSGNNSPNIKFSNSNSEDSKSSSDENKSVNDQKDEIGFRVQSHFGRHVIRKKTNPDLFVSNLLPLRKSTIKHKLSNSIIKEENLKAQTPNTEINPSSCMRINEKISPRSLSGSRDKMLENNSDISSSNLNESKKVTVSSIYYNDIKRESNNFEISHNYYYHISTPAIKLNEINSVVNENPLEITSNIKIEEYIKIGKFSNLGGLLREDTNIFIYDQFTAVPFKVIELTKREQQPNIETIKHSPNLNLKDDVLRKNEKLLIIVLNDFYDSYTKYEKVMEETWSNQSKNFEKINLVFFNFPGQAGTFFPKKAIFNNTFYSEFLDRFIYHLNDKGYFDHTYQLILVGFGNGGHVAITYSSCYEKYWDFLNSLILFNSYCENDDFINKSMLEILKIIESTKNPKLVNFFLKSVTVNPQRLLDLENNFKNSEMITFGEEEFVNEFDEKNVITNENKFSSSLNKMIYTKPSLIADGTEGITPIGIYNITRGYFYNIKLNLKDICTPIIFVHSNQNCFISMNNISDLFSNLVFNDVENNSNMQTNQNKITNVKSKQNKNKNMNQSNPSYYEKIPKKYFLENEMIRKKNSSKEDLNKDNINFSFKYFNLNQSEYDFSEILPNNTYRRKLIVVDGSHDLILENSDIVIKLINSYLRFVKNHVPLNSQNK